MKLPKRCRLAAAALALTLYAGCGSAPPSQQIAQNVSESFYSSDSAEQFWQLAGISEPPADGQPGLLVSILMSLVSILMSLVGSLLVPVITWLFLRRDWASLN